MRQTVKAEPRRIWVLTGPTGVGKTTLGNIISDKSGALMLSTSSLILSLSEEDSSVPNRASLQRLGNDLDRRTNHEWIAVEVQRLLELFPTRGVVVDAPRKPKQIAALRRIGTVPVVHMHLTASTDHLARSFSLRARDIDADTSFSRAQSDESESWHDLFKETCDLLLDTEDHSPEFLYKKLAEATFF